MPKRKADAKTTSVLELLREKTSEPKLCVPTSPRPTRRPRKSLSDPPLTSPVPEVFVPLHSGIPDREKDDLWDFIWAEVESPEAKGLPIASPTPATAGRRGSRRSLPVASPTPASEAPKASPQSGRPSPSPQSAGKSSRAIVPYVRRRIVGKQPPVLSIEVYTRRRLRGKQPAPAIPERKTISVRGHYDVLGVQRTATAAEIHAAYRRRALATHPDKGGDPRDFHRVKTAFEELSDEGRRTAYDRSLVLFGRRDGIVSEETPASSAQVVGAQPKASDNTFFGAARVAHFTLLANGWDTWPAALAKMQDGVLSTLRDILKGSKTLAAPADQGAGAGANGNLQGWQGPTCITQKKSGYKVTVSWEELSICTGFTKSLTQVIDWQIALLGMQSVAQLRLKRHGRAESRDPLTENELLQVLEREPGLELTFTITVSTGGKAGKKISSPSVMDLHTALEFRRNFLTALRGKDAKAALKVEKRNADQEAAKEKKNRRLLEQKLIIAVNEELQARSAGKSRGTGDNSSKALVLHHQQATQDNAKTPTPKDKYRGKSSPCKAASTRQRRTQVEVPTRKLRA